MDDHPHAPVPPPGFELLHPLGAGSSSVVWAARCVALGDTVALKWPTGPGPEATDALRREASLLEAVDHPNVVRSYDLLGGDGDRPVLVLEHADGGTLADVLRRSGGLPVAEVARLGAGVAAGLAALHRAGLVHGDVKPSNILLGDGGRPLLADLGAAHRHGEDAPGTPLAGSPAYLDPAVLGGAPADARTDVYGLGVTLHEALTGRLPGAAPVDADDGAGVDDGAGARLVAAIQRATAADPTARHASAEELAAELALVAHDAEATGAPHVPVALASRSGADERATRAFGPRPTEVPAEPAAVPRSRRVVAVAAAVVTAAALASPLSPVAAEPSGSAAAGCAAAAHGAGTVHGDLDGDGCPEALVWDGSVLTVRADDPRDEVRYAIGRPGDALLVGDWDCDGRDTPALHRPRTGEVVVFDQLPGPGQVLRGRTTAGPPGAGARVVTGADGCDRVGRLR